MFQSRKYEPILDSVNSAASDLAVPKSISWVWNTGSLLALCLAAQIVSGLFLSFHFLNSAELSFFSITYIWDDVWSGWLLRALHANGASLFFLCLYVHVGRGMYYGSFSYTQTWLVGVSILLVTMATAFLGYVLPWGQMSFWGATVITGLFSAVPYLGTDIVEWLWGGYSVGGPTLTRFFGLHFILPFVVAVLVIFHIVYLHQTGSNSPLGVTKSGEKSPFSPYFLGKDIMGFLVAVTLFLLVTTLSPDMLGDPENFNPSDPLSTPLHIQPEWYYLFAYAILRSIPSKLGGVVALVMSILVLYTMPASGGSWARSFYVNPMGKFMFWWFVSTALMLTWIGARPVESPYIYIGQCLTIMYFTYFLATPLLVSYGRSS